jgi:transcriptional regulator with XRE-family HTH domain
MKRYAGRKGLGDRALGDRMRALRRRAKMSQDQLAIELDCSQNIISFWENGDVWPSAKFIVAIVTFFRCDAHWLLTGDEYVP